MNIYFPKKENVCPCCHGTGVQRNQKTGLVQYCPCCFGSGKGHGYIPKPKRPIYTSKLGSGKLDSGDVHDR